VSAKPDVDTFQNSWELEQMLAVVERLQPARVLEVGSMWGGTLWHWLQIADIVVAIDDEMRRADEWQQWAADAGTGLQLLQGMSQYQTIVAAAAVLGPYDFIFIDGDHTYDAVKADWENYRGMAASGGIFAFHDTQHIGDDTYGVEQLWGEIIQETDVRWMHLAQTSRCGIGMLWL